MIRRSVQRVEPYRFTVDDYYRMAEAGILGEDDRVELLDGEILMMAPIGPEHAGVVDDLNAHFSRRLLDRAVIRVQNPIRLSDRSEPQPDIVLARPCSGGGGGGGGAYRRKHPGPAEVLLLVEVADTSRAADQRLKLPLYAAAGIPEVWIVDLQQRAIEVYTIPAGDAYRQHATYRGEDRLAPQAFPDCLLWAGDLFGE